MNPWRAPLRIGCLATLLGIGGAADSSRVANGAAAAPHFGGLDFLTMRIETGAAPTLPLPSDGSNPFLHDPGSLLTATIASLERSRDSLVHLETLRRALRYSIQSDGENAFGLTRALEAQLSERALVSSARGAGDPLAWLDAGVAALVAGEQYQTIERDRASLVEKAASLAPGDGGVRLMAALAADAYGGATAADHSAANHWAAASEAAKGNPNLRATLDALPARLRDPADSLPASRAARR
jgi:hypothetical protein